MGGGAETGLPSEMETLGDLTINYSERLVTVAGRRVQLVTTEYDVLCEIAVKAGRVFTHEHLLRRAWGMDNTGDAGPVRTYVKRLRRKLGDESDDPAYIFTKRRVGYWMEKAEGLEQEKP